MDNPFLKRLMKDEKKDIFHSSAYAKVKDANSMGVDSVESFQRRREIDRNRTTVRRYGDSGVASGSGVFSREARANKINELNTKKTEQNTLPEASVGRGRGIERSSGSGSTVRGNIERSSGGGSTVRGNFERSSGSGSTVRGGSERRSFERRNPGISR